MWPCLTAQPKAAVRVFSELSYFDGVNLAKRVPNHTGVSAALRDPLCPPSTVFGAFHNLAGERHMTVWAYNGHEGGDAVHVRRQLDWLAELSGFSSRRG